MSCIVVVEDEPEVLAMLRDLLRREGYQVVEVERPEDTDEAIKHIKPDLFLIDMMLPHESGLELALHLRKVGYVDTPIVAMSASKLMAAIAIQSGAFTGTVNKPFDTDDLTNRIDRYLRARK